jgi:hypothetical protein
MISSKINDRSSFLDDRFRWIGSLQRHELVNELKLRNQVTTGNKPILLLRLEEVIKNLNI